ncbi:MULTISPECIES: hypothetical protein [unclassified Pseudodesulfovibrio]|uniref:hypothetical protein n=1 Tax=unclassified Pseudodesulfovibrio TaxID=2661612 RepID=UPI000FEBB15C|nr:MULTISPECIES: hypothetical protein [unclassified Pseudodesulfovibrio]MCJ2165190.1 hypothetical protein [Pseudodesulfovibrio sp. S3-i]RWU03361.1 hypothetical protein DWB63_11095 [Pseudodesulfovibrio sp. S3]
MWLRLLIILGSLSLFPVPAAARDLVLLLHSESNPSAWTQDVATGLTAELNDSADVRQIFLQARSMDEDAFDDVFERLSQELAGVTPLAVVANGETAFAFARKYGDDLFPGAAVIFCSMGRPDTRVLTQSGNCTGIPMEFDLKGSVDLIFSMCPGINLVVAIADASHSATPLMEDVRLAMQQYTDRAQIMFPGFEPGDDNGLDVKTLAETLSSVPSSGAVLFLGFAEDREGNPVSDEELSGLFRSHGTSPIFVVRDAWPDSGVLGGWMISGRTIGRDAARLVTRIGQGEAVQEMLPEPTRPELRFDGTALTRFGLKAPPGAEITNQPVRHVVDESALPVSGLAWVFGLAALVALLYGIRRYRA